MFYRNYRRNEYLIVVDHANFHYSKAYPLKKFKNRFNIGIDKSLYIWILAHFLVHIVLYIKNQMYTYEISIEKVIDGCIKDVIFIKNVKSFEKLL